MQHEARETHVLWHNRYIQAAEDKLQSLSMLRLNACLGPFKEKALKAFVFEGADHQLSVT